MTRVHVLRRGLFAVVLGSLLVPAGRAAAEPDQSAPVAREVAAVTALQRDVAELRARLAAQQLDVERMQRTLEWQQRALDALLAERGQRDVHVATTRASSPTPNGTESSLATAAPASGRPADAASAPFNARAQETAAPLSWTIGGTTFTPQGFLELTAVRRTRNVASGLGTSFAGVPFSDTVYGNRADSQLSAQHSRLGVRIDARALGGTLLGLVETDFLGYIPGNLAVSSESAGPRLRLFWSDWRRGRLELLGGQSWSLLSPTRVGLSPLPSNIFNTKNVDPNYQVGLAWARTPQFRAVYHPSDSVAIGASVEAPDQYGGGSGGAGVITLPSSLSSSYSLQIDTGSGGVGVPKPLPDVIGKVAWDTSFANRTAHLEAGGLLRTFAFYNPLTRQHTGATGGGMALGGNVELWPGMRLFSSSFLSRGGGRWIFGLGPDFIIRADGTPSLAGARSTVNGIEWQVARKATLHGYYGGAWIDRVEDTDPVTGAPIGYGYAGSPDSHNRAIHEATGGMSFTFWRDPRYGAMLLNTQYSFVTRAPWYVAAGRPGSASLHMVLVSFRYEPPGMPPPK